MRNKSKVVLSISIDKNLSDLIKESIANRSKYIEWLIYQDMKNNNVKDIEKIII
jgi:transketolase